MEGISAILNAMTLEDQVELPKAQSRLQIAVSYLLKAEWDRLKSDLKKAQILVKF